MVPHSQPQEPRNKDGTLSKIRSHAGNMPMLPQNKLCPLCTAKFTRTTHLNRHLRSAHTNERLHKCTTCDAQFTRSDLLTRHRKTCSQNHRPRQKSCNACKESKIKCSGDNPCTKCISRGKDCVYAANVRKRSSAVRLSSEKASTSAPQPSETATTKPPEFETGSSRKSSSATSDIGDGLVHSHLSAVYRSDMFEPFFSGVFSNTVAEDHSVQLQADEPRLPFEIKPPSYQFLNEIDIYGQTLSSIFAQPVSELNDFILTCISGDVPEPSELQHYLYLFFTSFCAEMPLVHFPTFTVEGVPDVLLNAMRACGALFAKSPKAENYVSKVLASAREPLVQEFAKNPVDSLQVVHLILAVGLLQTLGLFHKSPDQRASSTVYHGMLVMMIRRTGLMQKNASWHPRNFKDAPLRTLWTEWAIAEMTKRALLLSFLHDTCQVIYFALPPSYNTSELLLNLPCEDTLFFASTAEEWLALLQTPSVHGTLPVRLCGQSLSRTIAGMSAVRTDSWNLATLTPLTHFILIHALLRQLFTVCVDSRLPPCMRVTVNPITDAEMEQEIFAIQYFLHSWLVSWKHSSEVNNIKPGEEPTFFNNALPFYWLAQVSLLAYQEGLQPFAPNSPENLNVEQRFRLIKHWLSHIRSFLRKTDETATLFWDELMKIRLKAWQLDIQMQPQDANDPGLISFFTTALKV